MIDEIARERLRKLFFECDKHLERMMGAANDMRKFMPLNEEKYTTLSDTQVRIIDQFLFRFSKLQDAMGQKLFKRVLSFLGEETEGVAFIDLLNSMEKLGLIHSAQRWRKLREQRNLLAHEYEDDPESISVAITMVYEAHDELKSTYLQIKEVMQHRGLDLSK